MSRTGLLVLAVPGSRPAVGAFQLYMGVGALIYSQNDLTINCWIFFVLNVLKFQLGFFI